MIENLNISFRLLKWFQNDNDSGNNVWINDATNVLNTKTLDTIVRVLGGQFKRNGHGNNILIKSITHQLDAIHFEM